MKVYCFIIGIFLCLNSISLLSQESIRYLYHKNWEAKHFKKPKDGKRWQDFEIYSRMYARYADPGEKTIPCVFNIISIGGVMKVDAAQIQAQLSILNNAFAGKYQPVDDRTYDSVIAGDTKIRFCMGDPNGNVDFINFSERNNPYSQDEFYLISDKKDGLEGAKKDNYLNIWITELPDQLGGLAIMPDQDSIADGIYIDPDFFGPRPESEYYKEGKTLIHLVGQYLGLKPLWAGQNCEDDGVEDTPIHNGPNYFCFPFSHISLCNGNEEEMIGNFMDATPDECSFMFTKGQLFRMHANLTEKGYRKELLSGIVNCSNPVNNPNSENRSQISLLNFQIIPNPASNIVEVKYENPIRKSNVECKITNSLGIQMDIIKIDAIHEFKGSFVIDISNYPSGNYFITVEIEGYNLTKSFIKI